MEPIWPRGIKIEVLGVTGEYESGKSLFVNTIDPENTLCFDFEKSNGCYEELGMTRIDVPELLFDKYEKKNGVYTPKDAFVWWLGEVRKVPKGKYSVITTDPISDIEDGLVDWVSSRYKEWGFSSEEKFKNASGIFWGRVKSEWKRILLGEITTKCQTFAFTTHLRQVFKYGKPVEGKFEAKGKNTLRETATLFLTLSRKPRKKGDPIPEEPWAEVDKNRLVVFQTVNGKKKIKGVTPPVLPVATPDAIREYINNPPDFSHLKEEELPVEHELSKEEELELQREIAEANLRAAEAQERVTKQQVNLQAAREKALAKMRPTPQEEVEQEEMEQEQEAQSTDDLLPEEDVRAVLKAAYKDGKSNDLLKGIWKILKDRGIDVSGFKVETAVDYARKLTQDEFEKVQESV